MTRAGRKPVGPALARSLNGSPQAKRRLEVILTTIAGSISIPAACEELGIEQAMLFRLRGEVLEAGLATLEPRPRGRPPAISSPAEQRCRALAQRVEELEAELKIAAVREEVAQITSRRELVQTAVKKTTHFRSRKTRRSGRRSRRRSLK